MFAKYLRKATNFLRGTGDRPVRRRRPAWPGLVLESLESRDLPAPLTWAAGVNLPTAAAGIVAQPEGAKLLVLAGPTTTSYNLSATDPTWQATLTPTVQPLDVPRTSPGVGPLPNGYYLVFGGTQNGFATAGVTQYDPNTVTVPDGATNQTPSLRSMNTPRALLGWATDSSTSLSYAIGGQDNNKTPLASVEAYNPSTNTWTFEAPLPQTLYSESAVSDGAGHLYTFGGVGASGNILNNVYRYTIATNTWDQIAPLQVAVRDSAAVLAPDGLIYVLGGTTAAGTTATVESYNPTTNTWTVETSLPQALSSEATAVDSLGRIEVLGGYDGNGNATASTFVSQKLSQADLAPTITSVPGKSAVVNSAYGYQVLSTANPQATYALSAAPAGMTINASTGLISWTPTYATEVIASVTVVASNSAGQATQTFSIGVAPQTPTGLTGAGVSTTAVSLSWNPSADPNVTGYNVYRRTFVHSPRGSGGSYVYSRIASNTPATSITITGAGSYLVSAVNTAGLESARSGVVTVATLHAPDLYTATTTSGADISSQTLSVGQTGQIYLIQEFANPAPTFSLVSGPSGVSVDPTTGLVTYTPVAADIGNQSVTFAATNTVGSSQLTFLYDVLALSPTMTVSDGPFSYDGKPHPATAAAVGVDGVTPVSGNFAFTYNGDPTPPTAAGTYSVVTTFTSADPSYSNASVDSSLVINPATPTITVNSGPFAYDGNPHAATATAVGVDGVTPVDGGFQFTYNGDPTAPTGPGLFTVSATFTSNDPNYTSPTVTANLIINSPGTLTPTLSLVDGSAPYDGNAHADTASAVGQDGVTPVAGAFIIAYNGSETVPTQAGSYDVVADFISSDTNYANAAITGSLTISAVAPTITLNSSYPFYYDTFGQAAHVSEVGVDGVTPVDGTLSVLYNGSSTLPVNAGTYDVSVTFTSNDSNYLSTTATGSMTIQQAGPSLYYQLNGGAYYYIYNGTPQGVTGLATGYFNAPINGSFTYAYYDSTGTQLPGTPTAAGYYTFTEDFTSLDPNYSSGTFSYSFAIYPATPTVTVTGGPFTYNGQGQAATATAVGIDGVTPVSGTASFTYNGLSSTPVLAGTYAVVATFTPTDLNYSSSTGSGTIVINKATPAFSGLSSPTVKAGTATVILSGHIAAGSAAPGGDDVAITLNGTTQPVSVSSGGRFSATFNTQGLAPGSYPITYEYLGDATRFKAAGGTGLASGTLTVQSAPSILTNPASQTVVSGNSVTFSASASGYPTPTVQWQQSTNGTTYTNISGATGLSYTIRSVTSRQNGYRYRAVFTNSAGSATTTAATLTVQYAPSITRNPSSTAVNAGQTATFTAAASGNPAPAVQWQVSTNGGVSFSNISGAISTTLTLTNTIASQNGYLYRAVFTNRLGTATTTAATLTVQFAPVVITNPTSQSVTAGQSVTFTAAANGNPPVTVQWQVSADGGATFTDIAGATSTTLTLTTTTKSQNGYQFRAVFTNPLGSAMSAAAVLTVL
jgi:MBG domain/Immunoglobulin domain/Kelch motif/Galactose oxidase, central domain